MLCLLNPEKMWAGSSRGLLGRVYVMKCHSQLVVSAIFTPGALELWGCRWPNAGVISSVSLIIYMELITLSWQFLLTQNCRCTKENMHLKAPPVKRQRENGAPGAVFQACSRKGDVIPSNRKVVRVDKQFRRVTHHCYSCKGNSTWLRQNSVCLFFFFNMHFTGK